VSPYWNTDMGNYTNKAWKWKNKQLQSSSQAKHVDNSTAE